MLIHENEANKQHAAFIGWLDHPGGWTPNRMMKTAKIGPNWLSSAKLRQFSPSFFFNDNTRVIQ